MTRKWIATIAAAVAITATPALAGSTLNLASSPEEVAAGVPKQFQGHWRLSLEECPPAITDRPIWINESRIRMDHSVGEVRSIGRNDRRNITLEGDLLSEGDPWRPTLHLKLSEAENELTISEGDWMVTLQRCPEEVNARD